MRADLYALRKSAQASWCWPTASRDANAAMDALMLYNTPELDWSKPETAAAVAEKAGDLRESA